ncbi:MAG TPA: hypothetical protein VFU74_09635 [Actinocrinis sp.]|nr:hypothetical protein [Actinocrinis sp.]
MDNTPGGTSEPEQPSATGSEDPFDIVLDEDFIKAAAAKEQSARTRELAAKWAKQPPTQTGWRTDGPSAFRAPNPPPSEPQKATKQLKTKRSGSGSSRILLRNAAIFVVAAAVAVVLFYPRHHAPAPLNATPAGTAQPWADASGASASPTPSPTFTNPDDQYFSGSPSLAWADNASGIVTPTAAKVGSFSAAQVADGYARMAKLLAAGNLDATILDGGPVTDFTKLIDPLEKLGGELEQWLRSPSYQDDPVSLVTRFNPKTTRLLGHIVKVNGTMSASVNEKGDLQITGDYRFVYAVGPAAVDGSPSRSVVHRIYQISISTPGKYNVTPGTSWVARYAANIANSTCFVYNGFINPDFGSAGAGTPGKTVDPYASSDPLLLPTGSGGSASPRPSGTPSAECDGASQL